MIKTIYCGASLLAIGGAIKDPENTLIMEPTGMVGTEFVDALGPFALSAPRTAAGRELFSELCARKAASAEGGVHVPAIAACLMLLIKKYNVRVLFVSAVTGVSDIADGVRVNALCLNERRTFECERYIDTTAETTLLEKHGALESCAIRALVRTDAGLPLAVSGARLERAFLKDTAVCTIDVDPTGSFADYREAVAAGMERLSKLLPDIILLSIPATRFVKAKPLCVKTGERMWIVPSCGRADALDALDFGFIKGGDFA